MQPHVTGEGGVCDETNFKTKQTLTHLSCDHSASRISKRKPCYGELVIMTQTLEKLQSKGLSLLLLFLLSGSFFSLCLAFLWGLVDATLLVVLRGVGLEEGSLQIETCGRYPMQY